MERRRENAIELEDDLRKFFEHAWPEIDAAEFHGNWHIDAVCEHLEAVNNGDITKLVINMPPRHSKSLLTSVAWPAWTWTQPYAADYPLCGPQVKFLCLSFSNDLVMDHSTLMRRLLQSAWYQTRWGHRVRILSDQDNKTKFDTSAGGTRISASFGGTVTGRGGDIKIFDDPHNMNEVLSDNLRNRTLERYTNVLASRITDPRHTAEVLVAQRGHEKDLSNLMLEDGDTVHLNLAAEFDPDMHRCKTVLGWDGDKEITWEDPRTEPGELLWKRFPRKLLEKFKADPYVWASQWQQAPKSKKGYIIQPQWWWTWGADQALADGLRWETKPVQGDEDWLDCNCMTVLEKGCDRNGCPRRPPVRDFPAMSLIIGSLDTAYTTKTENDRSALTIWGMYLNKERLRKFMLVYAWAGRKEIHDLAVHVATLCNKFNISRLLIESAAAGHPVEQEIRRIYGRQPWACELVPTGRLDKVARAHSVVQMFAEGMIYAPDTTWAQAVIDECVAGDTQIVTRDGLVPAEKIKPGDMVLTHRGRFRPVLAVSSRTASVMTIEAKTLAPITLTPNHPLYALDITNKHSVRDGSVAGWVQAERMLAREFRTVIRDGKDMQEAKGPSHAATLPVIYPEHPISEIDLRDWARLPGGKKYDFLSDDQFMASSHALIRPMRWHQVLDHDFGRIIGLYLAEGSTTRAQTSWSFNAEETGFVSEVSDFVENRLGCRVCSRTQRNATTVMANLPLLEDFFAECGRRAPNKKIPWWVWDAPDDFVRGLLSGYMDGDGHFDKPNDRMIGTTVSSSLAWGIRLLGMRLGIFATVRMTRPAGEVAIEGRTFKTLPAYTVSWRVSDRKNGGSAIKAEGCAGYSVMKKSSASTEAVPVFNMDVAEDHSYCTTGGLVHNCASFPHGEHDDRADTVFQALKWLRDRGFAIRAEEMKAEFDEAMAWRRPQPALYPGMG